MAPVADFMAEFPDPDWGLDKRLLALAVLAFWCWWLLSLFGPIVRHIPAIVQAG